MQCFQPWLPTQLPLNGQHLLITVIHVQHFHVGLHSGFVTVDLGRHHHPPHQAPVPHTVRFVLPQHTVTCSTYTYHWQGRKEGNVLFNAALNTFYLGLYSVGHMVKDHSDSENGNLMPPHGLLFPISSKGSFTCTIPLRGQHISCPLLHQSWSTGWNKK